MECDPNVEYQCSGKTTCDKIVMNPQVSALVKKPWSNDKTESTGVIQNAEVRTVTCLSANYENKTIKKNIKNTDS
jgi:hypothetical protein